MSVSYRDNLGLAGFASARHVSSGAASGGDLDCSDISGSVYVGSNDPNGFDADHDGMGCE